MAFKALLNHTTEWKTEGWRYMWRVKKVGITRIYREGNQLCIEILQD